MDGLGQSDVEPPELYPIVRAGLQYWKRPLRTLGGKNRYVATLVCEGGLPMHLVRESGTRFRRYFRELVAHLLHQARIDLVVEEGVDLQYLLGQYDAFFTNLLFQRFHACTLMYCPVCTGVL